VRAGAQGGRPNPCHGHLESEPTLLVSRDPAITAGRRIRVPESADRAGIMALVQSYLSRDPAARDLDSFTGLGRVLEDRYPCR
jgi:hypothetical protein